MSRGGLAAIRRLRPGARPGRYASAAPGRQKARLGFHIHQNAPHETAAPVLENHRDAHVMALREFDEIWAGDCENMLYSEIREKCRKLRLSAMPTNTVMSIRTGKAMLSCRKECAGA